MYVTPKEASKYYNVSEQALRSWAITGKIKYFTTKGGHRRYSTDEQVGNNEGEKVIYARVSSRKQQGDLDRQIKYLQSKYPTHRIVSDIGSGINFKRKGFKGILEGVFKGTIKEVVVAKRDRFTRFGFDLFEWIFEKHKALLIPDQPDGKPEESELSEDLMAIITVFTARYYGKRKYSVLQENKDLSN
jgi:predicted site-specific integrase-resolvase